MVQKIHCRISQQARFGEASGACVSQPDYDVDQLKSRLIEEWEHFYQVFIGEAITWRPRLPACIRAHGGHFEHIL